ncbi:hypothetical protein E1B28_012563 [Marasmius oreades]|uniref:F-box domain-containing protein n=1 Tax=Marasmius oreades TaxID=181124 RepID=A0A9P7RRQ6_9AGAR|nr:uncharacterized protein E1B28_012563 [Marasmius oreades]KAG7088586.1 hypothetical protein E1B28_012563 [Marasmius oreades]
MPSLLTLPIEVLDNIAFHVACPQIQGLPDDLTSFSLVSRRIYRTFSDSPALHAKIFKLKFSHSAISRRAFVPKSKEYAWQLKWFSQVLSHIRRRSAALPDYAYAFGEHDPDEPSVSELLFALWFLCLDDDGCNRLQMEHAGAYEWVTAFVHTQLYVKADLGWPLEDARNSCALWVMWYLTTKARLFSESAAARQQLVNRVLPFVTLPYRYPAAFAPPNHFHLPLVAGGPAEWDDHAHTSSIPTPHGKYPIYLSSDRVWRHVHFFRRTPTTVPLVSDSAKLLYFSRREFTPFGIPPHLPLTREDQRELLRQRFIAEAQENGRVLSSFELQRLIAAEISPTQEDIMEMNASLLGGELVPHSSFGQGGGTALTGGASIVLDANGRIIEVDESDCSSKRWDNDWWRLRQCRSCWLHDDSADTEETSHGDMMAGHPRQGRVYTPGSLTGLWSGRMLIPSQSHLEDMLRPRGPQPEDGRLVHPRPEDFTENNLRLTTVPVFMRLTEHVSYAPNPMIPCGGRSDSTDPAEREFDQGLSNGYFPNGMRHRRSPDGEGVIFSVPPPATSTSSVPQEYYYHTLKSKRGGDTNRLKPGKFHDLDSCSGCRVVAEARQKARVSATAEEGEEDDDLGDTASDPQDSVEDDDSYFEETAPPHDPHKVLDCDGIQDIVITGETDDRHGQAWNHFTFQGRVRHYDGMVGILRCPRKPGVGNVFFYGTIIGEQNFVGNWRVANVDVGMPAWEGAFSLGKKIE